MSELFRIDVENFNGDTVATLKNFQFFSYEQKIGKRGNFRLQLHDDDPNRIFIQNDYILRYWYKNDDYNIPWINPFNGIIKTPTRVWYGNGNKLAIFYGSDSNELFDGAVVMYPVSSPQAEKSDAVSTVMYDYLEENIGSLATIANGRYTDHVMPISIIYDGTGTAWTGNHAGNQMTKVLNDLRDFSHEQNDRIDYEIVYTGNYTWQCNIGKIFNDFTINGLNQSTGKNGAGNVPVILSPLYKNVDQYTESIQRVQETNVVLVLGQRVGDDREFYVASDPVSIVVSPIAKRESLAQTQNQEDLVSAGKAALEEKVGKLKVLIEPLFSESFALYRDLNLGDFFTVLSLDRVPQNKQFEELKVDVQQTEGGRTIARYVMSLEDREF